LCGRDEGREGGARGVGGRGNNNKNLVCEGPTTMNSVRGLNLYIITTMCDVLDAISRLMI
jgi:hypothetical protein